MIDNGFKNLKFMVIEDNFKIKRYIHQILKDNNAKKVIEISSTDDALWKMEIIMPDVLIIGWNLSSVDGVKFIKFLRTSPNNEAKYLPIILIAKFFSTKDVEEARDAGASEILVAPFSVKNLYTRICSVINRPRVFINSSDYTGPDRRRKRGGNYSGADRRRHNKDFNDKNINKLLGISSS